ncbi:MAG: ribosome biogenesis GTPase Der [Pseudomonadota bacterium]
MDHQPAMPSSATIAIIGRPNVGKSTLFNRLTGKRTALVSDMPGLTRDRREGQAEIGSHTVTLIDTAGLEEARAGSIAARMREQSEKAIQDADLVLFVLDARDGVTPADTAFARIVRQSGRPSIVVANKCEGRRGQDGFYEAYELGLGSPVPISAEHGEGLGEMLADIEAALGLEPPAKTTAGPGEAASDRKDPMSIDRAIRVAIVGRPNAGKSTLVNAFLGEDRMITGPEPGLTRDSVSSEVSIGDRKLLLFDTAGLRRKAKIDEVAEKLSASDSIRAIRFAEVVVLIVDAERPFEHQDLTIGDMVTQEGRGLVIAINKWDLVPDKQAFLKRMYETVAERLSQVPNVKLVPISALAERNLDKLADAIFEAYRIWNTRIPTADLNRWLIEATHKHQPPAVSGRRIRLRFMTQPSARPPTFVAFCSKPKDLPKSYVRYLTGSLRSAFDLPGVPIRLNLRKGENPYAPRKRRN